MNAGHLPLIGFTSLLILSISVSHAETVTLVGNEYTRDWHPHAFDSYPAQRLAQLTTESLLERQCRAVAGGSDGQYGYAHNCLDKNIKIDMADRQKSIRLAFDEGQCPSLSQDDIRYTLQEINARNADPYHYYGLQLRGTSSPRLELQRPRNPSSFAVQEALTFPILRSGSDDHEQTIGPGGDARYNRITGGRYRMEQIGDEQMVLTARNLSGKQLPVADQVEYRYFNRVEELLKEAGSPRRPDVLLGLPASHNLVNGGLYEQYSNPELTSVTYLGFNFRSKQKRVTRIMAHRDFREIFTHSLWATTPIRALINVEESDSDKPGIFLGESFEVGYRYDVSPYDPTKAEHLAATYLDDEAVGESIPIRILVEPGMNAIFSDPQFENLVRELNAMWRNGPGRLQFSLERPPTAADYGRALKEGDFEMLLATLVCGRNLFKVMAFLDPQHPSNQLGISLFSTDTVKQWYEHEEEGIEAMRQQVQSSFPVAIIGQFPRRDYFSTSVTRPTTNCPDDSRPVPYATLHLWHH